MKREKVKEKRKRKRSLPYQYKQTILEHPMLGKVPDSTIAKELGIEKNQIQSFAVSQNADDISLSIASKMKNIMMKLVTIKLNLLKKLLMTCLKV